MDDQDLAYMLSCLWISNALHFSHERERVQLAPQLHTAAYTGARPSSLLAIKYEHLEFFKIRDHEKEEDALLLWIALKDVKNNRDTPWVLSSAASGKFTIAKNVIVRLAASTSMMIQSSALSGTTSPLHLPMLLSQTNFHRSRRSCAQRSRLIKPSSRTR